VRFEVLVAVKMTMLFFWGFMSCRLVGRYQRIGETKLPTTMHYVATQKKNLVQLSEVCVSVSLFSKNTILSITEACAVQISGIFRSAGTITVHPNKVT
jgi:hypothetical protein